MSIAEIYKLIVTACLVIFLACLPLAVLFRFLTPKRDIWFGFVTGAVLSAVIGVTTALNPPRDPSLDEYRNLGVIKSVRQNPGSYYRPSTTTVATTEQTFVVRGILNGAEGQTLRLRYNPLGPGRTVLCVEESCFAIYGNTPEF